MWFIFPQMRELRFRERAEFYGISKQTEAEGYLAHPILGTRLRECVELMLAIQHRFASDMFGVIDQVKLASSSTLFYAG